MGKRQIEHLERARKAKLEKAKHKKIEELTRMTEDDEDDEFRKVLLAKAKEAFYKKQPLTKVEEIEDKKIENKVPVEDLQQQLKDLKAEIEALKRSKNNDKNVSDVDEEEVDDSDVDKEDVEDLKEDLEDELEDLLDEDERDIFELLNRLHELQIIQIKQECEKVIEQLHKEYEQKERNMNSIKSKLQGQFNMMLEKDRTDKDIGFQNYFNKRLNAYRDYIGGDISDKVLSRLKTTCYENYYNKPQSTY